MSSLYKRPEWIAYRAEVIELDDGRCRECGKGERDGVTLHVHHLEYHPGKLPWEYPYAVCKTLCQRHHAEEHGLIRPNSGWAFLYDEDLKDLSGTCEWCNTEIRYVFHIDHPKWDPLAVGTDCCDRLTGSDVALNIRRKFDRLKSFIRSRRWEINERGLFIRQKRMDFFVVSSSEGYTIELQGVKGKENQYKTLNLAKEKIFTIVENGEAEIFLKKRKV